MGLDLLMALIYRLQPGSGAKLYLYEYRSTAHLRPVRQIVYTNAGCYKVALLRTKYSSAWPPLTAAVVSVLQLMILFVALPERRLFATQSLTDVRTVHDTGVHRDLLMPIIPRECRAP